MSLRSITNQTIYCLLALLISNVGPPCSAAIGQAGMDQSGITNWHASTCHRLTFTGNTPFVMDGPLEQDIENQSRSSQLVWTPSSLLDRIVLDHNEFYTADSIALVLLGTVATAPIANSDLDRDLLDWMQRPLGGSSSRQWTRSVKPLGDGIYTLPVFVGAWLFGTCSGVAEVEFFGEWGERSLRTFLLGAPPLLLGQIATGGSRPGETEHASHWRPFADDNGMSGHSFMGAFPCINAAKMSSDIGFKALFYSASLVVPLSRIADNAHYPSQAFLGWWLAYAAASAVDRTNRLQTFQVQSVAPDGSNGFAIQYRY